MIRVTVLLADDKVQDALGTVFSMLEEAKVDGVRSVTVEMVS